MLQPKISEYQFLDKLGTGSYATVFKATHKKTKENVAIKCIETTELSNSAKDSIITEIRLLKTLKHQYIVEMKDFLWDDKNIYIVMEYCNYGDLARMIKSRTVLPESTCRIFLRQLSAALQYMRSNEVSHFDLKPQNLLLARSSTNVITLKVADFGFAQYLKLDEANTQIKGSPLYMAPEILLKHCYDCRADLWSIGIILYECLFGKAPYSSKTMQELLDKIKNLQKIQLPPNSKISAACEDLLTRLLKHNPEERISFEDFFNHEFLDLKHAPTDENLERAIELVTKAVELDNSGNFTDAYYLYCESLQFFIPIIHSETDATKRQALRAKAKSYMQRAEELKACVSNKNCTQITEGSTSQPSAGKKNQLPAALTPSMKFQQLYKLSSSSPELKHSLDIGRKAELYLCEKNFEIALKTFTSALSCLMPILNKEPKGGRRDLLHFQIVEWMKEAESIKALLLARTIDEPLESENLNPNCCIQ
jgi:serine/threonine-protein kinase ULK3